MFLENAKNYTFPWKASIIVSNRVRREEYNLLPKNDNFIASSVYAKVDFKSISIFIPFLVHNSHIVNKNAAYRR